MSKLTKKIVFLSVTAIIIAALIVGNIIAGIYAPMITSALSGTGVGAGENIELAQKEGDALCQEIMAEGMVLFKNDNDALPLAFPEGEDATMNINVLGWSSTDAGFLLRGIGSGSSTIRDVAKVTFLDALEDEGFVVNPNIINMYESYKNTRETNSSGAYVLVEPPQSYYADLIDGAVAHSDTAVVVFSRNGGENVGEIPVTQTKFSLSSDSTRTHLQASTEEEALLTMAAEKFEKVILIINTANIMHLDFLDDERVDAAIFVGLTGQSGTRSIAKMLKGEINPSGKTSDIYARAAGAEADPTWVNKQVQGNTIQYVEDIYYGYKWYETADADGLLDDPAFFGGGGYDKYVQYPFGHGKSFTEFEWTVSEVNIPSPFTATSEITVKVDVENIGNMAGKDVIQVYYTPPYTSGGIEKAHVNLVAFAKTTLIEPGEKIEDITLTFSAYDMASYDCYNKSGLVGTDGGYILEHGSYQIKVMHDSHTVNASAKAVTAFTLASDILFDNDPVTGTKVENQFTGSTAYAGVPTDGSTAGLGSYMTRANFKGTFPTVRANSPSSSEVSKASNFVNNIYDQTDMPAFGYESGFRLVQTTDADGSNPQDSTYDELNGSVASNKKLVLNEELILEIGADYDHDDWEMIMNQLTAAEVKNLVECSGFKTRALESIGKPRCLDFDGPAGFNSGIQGAASSTDWTAYPSETLVGCTFGQELLFIMGLTMGFEASQTNLNGWYAPGVNLHRSPYTARNFEYYGEDGVHSGKMAAMVIKGAKANGLYCYIKHYALSEPGPNPRNVNTWATEQNIRENYLRPFELAVKDGGSNALMTAFNRVGAVWAGANHALNVTILRNEWGFRGTVLTDWTNGEGTGGMNPKQGVRAGNDIWLNPSSVNNNPLTLSDPTDMYCAKQAAKNVLFTYTNTLYFQMTFDLDDELAAIKAKVGVRTPEPVFPWWIILVVGVEIIIVAGLAFWGIMVFKPELLKRKKKDEQAAQG